MSLKIGYINQKDTVYIEVIDRISENFKRKEVIPFFGAGISFDSPSCLPGGNALQYPLIELLLKVSRLSLLQEAREKKGVNPFSQKTVLNARLEQLLDVLQKTHGKAILPYLNVLLSDNWNNNHGAIATLAINGYLPNCITLNFDLLIEKAIHSQGKSSKIVTPLTNGEFKIGSGDPCIEILKPHGSFIPPEIHFNPFEFLSATLSEVGHIPDKRNSMAIKNLLSCFPILIIGGYSDNDWDIFPILISESDSLREILWIEYLDINHNTSENRLTEAFQTRVKPWLSSFKGDSTILYGASKQFLCDILKNLDLNLPKTPNNDEKKKTPDVSFLSLKYTEHDPPTIRTLISFSMLQPTSASKIFLLQWLKKHPLIKAESYLLSILEDQIGHEFHTIGKMRKAIRCTKKVLAYKKETKDITKKEIVDIYIWLGYEYLCLAKRPLIPFFHWPILIPYYKHKANYFFNKGLSLVEELDVRSFDKRYFRGLVEYYKADLLHSWGNLMTFLFGQRFTYIQKKYFSCVYNKYNVISEQFDVLEDRYHWLRRLEAFLFSGGKIDNYKEIEKRIDEVHQNYIVLQNFVQLGNTYAYLALLKYHQFNFKKEESVKLLKKAASVWSKSGEKMASAQRRLIVFRRYFGDIGLFRGILYFFNLKDIFNEKWSDEI